MIEYLDVNSSGVYFLRREAKITIWECLGRPQVHPDFIVLRSDGEEVFVRAYIHRKNLYKRPPEKWVYWMNQRRFNIRSLFLGPKGKKEEFIVLNETLHGTNPSLLLTTDGLVDELSFWTEVQKKRKQKPEISGWKETPSDEEAEIKFSTFADSYVLNEVLERVLNHVQVNDADFIAHYGLAVSLLRLSYSHGLHNRDNAGVVIAPAFQEGI